MEVVAFRKVEDPEPQLPVRRQKDREHNLLVLPLLFLNLKLDWLMRVRENLAQLEESIYELSDLDELVGYDERRRDEIE